MIAAIVYALPFLMQGLLITIVVSLLTVGISLLVGGAMGVGLVYGPAPLRWVVRAFSDQRGAKSHSSETRLSAEPRPCSNSR